MVEVPVSLTIRMYNVGFGDCFLLSFKYARGARHWLVDYGSASAPRKAAKDFMPRIANDIRNVCAGKLDVLLATHRHRDHVSGFSTDAVTGRIIAALNPDHVIQPWTEDPQAKASAVTASSALYTHGKPDRQKIAAHFLGSLEDMHAVAEAISRLGNRKELAGAQTLGQLKFIGEDNIKNPSAVRNLTQMGTKGRAYYVNAGMELNILPGVKCTVLGPPTLAQSDAIRSERARDPSEFWQFRSFWASQGLAARSAPRLSKTRVSAVKATRTEALPPNVRWFVRQARQIHADEMLGLVRDLDGVMNNTSVVLLLEVGTRKILLPGDAQLENWAYALSRPEWKKRLADVNLYKVGHHGSLNATPKSLWALFRNKGTPAAHARLETLCSTKAGTYGSARSGTEVPRKVLLEALKKDSAFTSSEESADTFCHQTELDLRS